MSVELIEHNPTFKKPAMLLLETSMREDITNRTQLEAAVQESWDPAWRHTPDVMIDILVNRKALEEVVTVDGQVYAGTLQDMQLDMNIDEDAELSTSLAATSLGEQILSDYAPQNTLEQLFAGKQKYIDVFKTVLATCSAEDGCSLVQLEAAIEDMPQLKPDPTDHQTKVYAQYFIDALESAGAIEWKGSWRLTAAGQDFLAA